MLLYKNILICAALAAVSLECASAEILCKNRSSAVFIRKKCLKGEKVINLSKLGSASIQGVIGATGPQGEQGPQGAPGLVGPQGPQGPIGLQGISGSDGAAGVDGSLRIYGDGSAGDLIINSSTSWLTSPPNSSNNLQFENFSLAPGRSLVIPSGAIIRCNNICTINGSITVITGTNGGRLVASSGFSGDNVPGIRASSVGLSSTAASTGEYGNSSLSRFGGDGGIGFTSVFQASTVLHTGPRPSGSGAGSIGTSGGQGGGSITILAKNGIVIGPQGRIFANASNGSPGAGGGAGGFIILASQASVTNFGALSAVGGNGGNASLFQGNGGGGSGGIVHFLAPIIVAGNVDVSGGQGAAAEVTISSTQRIAGAGGGALFGNGGGGADIAAGTVTSIAGNPGSEGVFVQSLLDPTALF